MPPETRYLKAHAILLQFFCVSHLLDNMIHIPVFTVNYTLLLVYLLRSGTFIWQEISNVIYFSSLSWKLWKINTGSIVLLRILVCFILNIMKSKGLLKSSYITAAWFLFLNHSKLKGSGVTIDLFSRQGNSNWNLWNH